MTSIIEERRARLALLQENYEKANRLEQELADVQTQLARAQQKRDAFAAHGNKRIEVPNPHQTQLGLEFELEPFRSKLTGTQLAKQIESAEVAPLEAEIRRREKEIKSLLSDKG